MSTANRSFKYRLSTNVSAAAVYVTRAQKNAMSLSSTALNTKRNVNNWSKHTDWPTVIKFYLFVRMYQHIISIHKKKIITQMMIWKVQWFNLKYLFSFIICKFTTFDEVMKRRKALSLTHKHTHTIPLHNMFMYHLNLFSF